jgi:hypothetical protein
MLNQDILPRAIDKTFKEVVWASKEARNGGGRKRRRGVKGKGEEEGVGFITSSWTAVGRGLNVFKRDKRATKLRDLDWIQSLLSAKVFLFWVQPFAIIYIYIYIFHSLGLLYIPLSNIFHSTTFCYSHNHGKCWRSIPNYSIFMQKNILTDRCSNKAYCLPVG